ncbi:MAG: MFS transporter, partial [Blastocatellia bacterium]
ICIGQLVSILGSGLTNFAIGIWVYQNTGSVTKFALTILAASLPSILISPFAGALVDRWDRRRTMILGDSVAGICSLAIALLLYFDGLQVWHVCLIIAVAAIAGVLHGLAFTASLPMLIPKDQFGRIGGIMQIGPAVAQIVSPLLAGMMLAATSIYWVLIVDFVTFLFAVSMTIIIRIPRPSVTAEGESAKGSLLREAAFGWTYVKARPGLIRLLIFFAVFNFVLSIADVALLPMWFGMTSVEGVGRIASIASFGMLIGGITLSVWGGPGRRIHGVLGFAAMLGLCLVLMGLRPSLALITIASFGLLFTVPFINGCDQAIWLRKTPPDVQGRVSSIRMMIPWSTAPLAYLIAGPLADKVFEPLLAVGGPLAGSVGKIIGVGAGRGIGLMIIVLGMLLLLSVAAGYMSPRLRLMEDELPDAIPEAAAAEENGDPIIADKTAATV